jgi:CBS domain-containing protein
MVRHSISGLTVLNERQEVIGIVSDKDFLSHRGGPEMSSFMGIVAQELAGEDYVAPGLGKGKAGDIMTSPAVTITETTPVFEIAHIFENRKINRVPVLDRNGRLTGIVSRADIVRTICMV